MKQNRKAVAGNNGPKTLVSAAKQKAFSFSDYKSELEPVQEIIERIPLGTPSETAINCFDCKRNSRLDGYRFSLVPLCKCCRTERELQIIRNRFDRRHKR